MSPDMTFSSRWHIYIIISYMECIIYMCVIVAFVSFFSPSSYIPVSLSLSHLFFSSYYLITMSFPSTLFPYQLVKKKYWMSYKRFSIQVKVGISFYLLLFARWNCCKLNGLCYSPAHHSTWWMARAQTYSSDNIYNGNQQRFPKFYKHSR